MFIWFIRNNILFESMYNPCNVITFIFAQKETVLQVVSSFCYNKVLKFGVNFLHERGNQSFSFFSEEVCSTTKLFFHRIFLFLRWLKLQRSHCFPNKPFLGVCPRQRNCICSCHLVASKVAKDNNAFFAIPMTCFNNW